VKQASIPKSVTIHQVLDNCHATHHVSRALASLGITEADRMPLYRELRTKLRNGQWRAVVAELETLTDDNPQIGQLQTEINYLQRPGDAGRLAYPTFRGHWTSARQWRDRKQHSSSHQSATQREWNLLA